VTGISLTKTAGGVTSTNTGSLSAALTISALASAINQLSGWQASPQLVAGGIDWATADINADLGARGALGGGCGALGLRS